MVAAGAAEDLGSDDLDIEDDDDDDDIEGSGDDDNGKSGDSKPKKPW